MQENEYLACKRVLEAKLTEREKLDRKIGELEAAILGHDLEQGATAKASASAANARANKRAIDAGVK